MTVPATRLRTRHHPERWQRLVSEQAASGLPARAFCAERDLSYSSFLYWRRKLIAAEQRRNGVSEPRRGPAFIELLPGGGGTGQGGAWELELELGDGLVLRLRRP